MKDDEIVAKLMQLALIVPQLANPNQLKEGDIAKIVNQVSRKDNPLRTLYFGDAEILPRHIETVIENLETQFSIVMDNGSILEADNHEKWYMAAKASRSMDYWDRYEGYLEIDQRLPKAVIQKIDLASDEIMDALGDPQSDRLFQRKGLVIGAVQSGKTSNYIALMNKAADSGYKVFILLTGMVEKLRAQTQERVDAGFVGIDSKFIDSAQNVGGHEKFVGVGKRNRNIWVDSFTSTEQDFDNPTHTMQLNRNTPPIVFVVKKNRHILEKLREWLKRQVTKTQSGKVDLPLLLIDDEADNASVNTNKTDKDPTAINSEIRKMLKMFTRYSYVGFTATPFANIFIDPQFDENGNAAEQDDLFPKDFIYLLEQPSNYIGPVGMYSGDGEFHYMLRYNDDMESALPLKHKRIERMAKLPDSLKEAIDLFLIANAIRDLRGQQTKHRSMLIHVSRFIDVQRNVESLVQDYFTSRRVVIKNFARAETENEPYIRRLHHLFDQEYGAGPNPKHDDIEFSKAKPFVPELWGDVKQALYKSILPIQIHTINSGDNGNANQRLDYSDYPDGLRLIAIGGLSLARGLTLEGLMISYFYRNTKMYDTLMQMGRWFGYRDNYSDLCRLWTSEESSNWYAQISLATEDLRSQIRQMAQQNKRPIEFGLRVRSAEETPLIVTARNKMTSAKTIPMKRQLNGQVVETPIVWCTLDEVQKNYDFVDGWIEFNYEYLEKTPSSLGKPTKPTLKNVPKSEVVKLLESMDFPMFNVINKDSEFVREIKRRKNPVLSKWDVVIATNDIKDPDDVQEAIGGIKISPVQRKFDYPDIENCIRISGSKKRLSNISYATTGMNKSTYDQVVLSVNEALQGQVNQKGTQRRPSETNYFNTGVSRNPLLVIFPVELKKAKLSDPKVDQLVDELAKRQLLVCGISVGIPDTKGADPMSYTYTINKVAQMKRINGSSVSSSWNPEDDDEDEGVND